MNVRSRNSIALFERLSKHRDELLNCCAVAVTLAYSMTDAKDCSHPHAAHHGTAMVPRCYLPNCTSIPNVFIIAQETIYLQRRKPSQPRNQCAPHLPTQSPVQGGKGGGSHFSPHFYIIIVLVLPF